MKEVTIDGVRYVSAAIAAKEFKYTTDYIGQLCRAKRVDAQLVGRSWYVNPDSLAALRTGGKYSRTKSKNTKADEPVYDVKVSVEPVLNKTTVKMNDFLSVESKNFAKRIDWKPLRYESDEADLLPSLKPVEPKIVKVDLAESSEIAIKSGPKSTNFITSELPAVSLKGKLKVTSIEEAFIDESVDDGMETFDEMMVSVSKAAPVSVPKERVVLRKVSIETPVFTPQTVVTARESADDSDWFGMSLTISVVTLSSLLLLAVFVENTIWVSGSEVHSTYLLESSDLLALLAAFR